MNNIHELAKEPLLNAKQVAVMCGISDRTLFNYVKGGNFPKPIRPNTRTRRWKASEVESWINNNQEAA